MTTPRTVNTISEILQTEHEQWETPIRQAVAELRCCLPGIIQSFDATKQTVVVQLAVQETVVLTDSATGLPSKQQKTIPVLLDVPIVWPRSGGYVLTCPIVQGDECLVTFADLNYNAWWQNGGVQPRMDSRRHDFSDAFAILGTWSQPRVLSNYSMTSAQLRNEAGTNFLDLSASALSMNFGAHVVSVSASEINLQLGTTTIVLSASGIAINTGLPITIDGVGVTLQDGITSLIVGATAVNIEGYDFLPHYHIDSRGQNTTGVDGVTAQSTPTWALNDIISYALACGA